jgi:F-type H+-transporting ATPase subunit epsilon
MKLALVTPERTVFSDEVNAVIAPGTGGQMGILPHHIPLVSTLQPGEVLIRKGEQDWYVAISGGFIIVQRNGVTILADSAEKMEEIDLASAEEASQSARQQASRHSYDTDRIKAEAELRRALARLKVARRRKRESGGRI